MQTSTGFPSLVLANYGLRIQIRIVLSHRNCVPNSLAGHQLIWTLGRFDLWKQVQKTERIVDFTNVGAKIDKTSRQNGF
jgi:hypothetical protein